MGKPLSDHPVIAAVVDELRDRGAKDQAGAELLLPALESDWGQLTERELTAVLEHFGS